MLRIAVIQDVWLGFASCIVIVERLHGLNGYRPATDRSYRASERFYPHHRQVG
jgi:hypothetical protein